MEREAIEAAEKQQEKIDIRRQEESEQGKKKRGRKPKSPEDMKNKNAKANITGPASRIMKTRAGYVQGYNAQAVVTEEQIILAADITQEENDVNQLHSMLNKVKDNIRCVGIEDKLRSGLVDAGYWSEGNLRKELPDELDLFAATKKDWKQRKEIREQKAPRGRIPEGLSEREQMESRTSDGPDLLNTFIGLSLVFNFSLRVQEQCFTQFSIVLRTTEYGIKIYPAFLAVLISLKSSK